MRQGIVAVLVVVMLTAPALAQTKQKKIVPAFRALGTLHFSLGVGDWAITQFALKRYPDLYGEANPIAKLWIDSEYLSLAIMSFALILVNVGTEAVYRENRTLGWILRLAFVIGHGLVIAHNLKLLAENR